MLFVALRALNKIFFYNEIISFCIEFYLRTIEPHLDEREPSSKGNVLKEYSAMDDWKNICFKTNSLEKQKEK